MSEMECTDLEYVITEYCNAIGIDSESRYDSETFVEDFTRDMVYNFTKAKELEYINSLLESRCKELEAKYEYLERHALGDLYEEK